MTEATIESAFTRVAQLVPEPGQTRTLLLKSLLAGCVLVVRDVEHGGSKAMTFSPGCAVRRVNEKMGLK